MKVSTFFTGLACIGTVVAEAEPEAYHRKHKGGGGGGSGGRPSDVSICDYYTKALLGSDSEANQELLLTLLVNTAVIGNYTQPNLNYVPGILKPNYFNGEYVNLLQYFNGDLASTNNGGKCGAVVNFLDGGGAAPLTMNKPAACTSCNQYFLLTHLYKFFAALLGCSIFGNTVKPYDGTNGMYQVHKFMALDNAEVGYFINNVGLSAASFGVSSSDVAAVGAALMGAFGYRCEPPASIPAFESPQLQSICTECDCPVAPSPDCGAYGPIIEPKPAKYASRNCGEGYFCGRSHHSHKE